ncbi:enoyl-CoA hydratase/isomerase family protein [Diaphorobacter sp. HDW4A]|uniref:enoyl-CoA hydratase/isomerase family protein n=1 Tax=Diaphorobacter sp. HDW4A TaxID=2714924 RepID=UPI00140C1117|nr:enoyl-CoA hydratase/isomerase family protein [Diaphorobacter sp. HDW4A]QIL79542.1 enoyl-CoA hydratase/isomerase family protein [Diaphorobacter sp. HDW4A]
MQTPAASIQTVQPGIALLRLERPKQLNALSLPDLRSIHCLLDQVLSDASLRVLILTGEGDGFCAGLNLKSMLDANGGVRASVAEHMELQQTFAGLVQRLRDTPLAVIAAVNGVAVGAGMAMALAADIRFADPKASFHVGAVKIGITAGECGISYHLPRLIGAGRAFELMLSGRAVAAEEALRIGLVSDVVDKGAVLERALYCARQIAGNAPYATAHTKKLMWQNLDASSLKAAIELENHAQVLGLMTADFQEAVQAFLQKRDPVFTGR